MCIRDRPQEARPPEEETTQPGKADKASPAPVGEQRVIVFLKRARKGTLYAEDGFLFTLPHDGSLERLVRYRVARLADDKAQD